MTKGGRGKRGVGLSPTSGDRSASRGGAAIKLLPFRELIEWSSTGLPTFTNEASCLDYLELVVGYLIGKRGLVIYVCKSSCHFGEELLPWSSKFVCRIHDPDMEYICGWVGRLRGVCRTYSFHFADIAVVVIYLLLLALFSYLFSWP